MPTIVAYDGMYQLPKNVMDLDASKRFDFIFDHGVWARSAGNESMSGCIYFENGTARGRL